MKNVISKPRKNEDSKSILCFKIFSENHNLTFHSRLKYTFETKTAELSEILFFL